MLFVSNLALILALLVNPWLLARNLHRRADAMTTLALAGACAISLGILAPVCLHVAGIPITAGPLSAFHAVVFLAVAGLAAIRSIRPHAPVSSLTNGGPSFAPDIPFPLRSAAGMALLFAILVIPFTPMAGKDTYKFQDLATVVQMDKAISWFIHPSSLFGFTPRSYASGQPLLLSSIAIMSGTGVAGGYYILSVLCGITGLASVTLLGRHLFRDSTTSSWMALFYVFSLVFLRYNFWAIGRGMFMDLLPLFVFGLFNIRHFRAVAGTIWCAVLLCLSHKTGWIAVTLIPASFLAGVILLPPCRSSTSAHSGIPPLGRIVLPCGLFLGAITVGYALAGFSPAHAIIRVGPRLSVLLPLAFVGSAFVLAPPYGRPAARAMAMAAFAFLPLVFTDEMYGALVAVLFIAFLAAVGFDRISFLLPPRFYPGLRNAVLAAVLLPATLLIAYQSTDSPSRDVVRAARFLNRHDPLGPYRIEAPGPTRPQMQAYLDGCPRFNVSTSSQPLKFQPPPTLTGSLRQRAVHLTAYLRKWLTVPEASTDWYGATKKVYYITVGNQGMIPPGARRLFTSGDVSVYDNPAEP